MKKVKQNDILIKGLKPLCLQPVDKIMKGQKYIYNDSHKSKILAVAHVDTVADHYGLTPNFSYDKRYSEVYSISLDDRLGVHTILNTLPEYGINLDYVFTTDEEIGRSTARDFVLDHPEIGEKYNWIIEFDRRGLDPVSYIYEYQLPVEVLDCVTTLGLIMEMGSFSDISEMGSLGICGINWGIGYDNEHTFYCHVNTMDYFDTVLNFVDFYNQFADTKMPFTLVPKGGSKKWYDDYDWKSATTTTVSGKGLKGKSINSIGKTSGGAGKIQTGLCMDCHTPTSRWDGKVKGYICEDCREFYLSQDWRFSDGY